MATTPSPAPVLPTVATTESWLKTHEKLIITLMVLLTALYLGKHFIDYRANLDGVKAEQAQAQLLDQKTANAQLAAQVQQSTAQYQTLIAQLTQQNAQLSASIATRNTNLTVQQTTDKTLPLPALATRWASLAGFDVNNLKADTDGIDVSSDAAVTTVQQLEQVPVLTQNLKAATTEATNVETELTSANSVIVDQKSEIAGLNTQIVDAQKACTTEVTAVKAQARKSKWKWFGIGYVSGFISGLLVHGA